MHHRRGYRKLGRNPSHRRATLRNLVTNLLERERITTTVARAKELRPLAERMITLGKRDTLHSRCRTQKGSWRGQLRLVTVARALIP